MTKEEPGFSTPDTPQCDTGGTRSSVDRIIRPSTHCSEVVPLIVR
jgi:hypothetical protein